MDEIKAIKRMLGILDAAVHVNTALTAGVALNGRVRIDDGELLRILAHAQLVARHYGDLREQRARGLPAFGASAHVIVGALTSDTHRDGVARAFALQRAPRKARRARLHTIVYCGMNGDLCHGMSSQTWPTELLLRRSRPVMLP